MSPERAMPHDDGHPNEPGSAATDRPAGRRTVGRAAGVQPANRYERVNRVDDFEQLDAEAPEADPERRVPTQFWPDQSQSLLSENSSPDVPFRWSINPYRGCEHGCAYCYARPSHEQLGFSAGLDFETQILVKHQAAAILRRELCQPRWQGELISLSGNTDCYQPAERQFRLTRACLEVTIEARQAVGVITKNTLVVRDLDLLAPHAERRLAHVLVSLTTLDQELARRMEPRTGTPAARLETIRRLAAAGIPVQVMVAPIIPGLNDQELPAVLAAAREAGAQAAGYLLVRLPHTVEPVFSEWLTRNYPDRAERVVALVRSTRDGAMSDSQFGRRHRGQGPYAAQIRQTFEVFARKLGLARGLPELDLTQFRPPRDPSGQRTLF